MLSVESLATAAGWIKCSYCTQRRASVALQDRSVVVLGISWACMWLCCAVQAKDREASSSGVLGISRACAC